MPPSFGVKVQRTTSLADFTVQSCAFVSFCFHCPFSKTQSIRTARILISRFATALPSRSVTIACTTRGSPCCTKVRSLFKPTYKSAGCTSKVVEVDHCWRFTSVTLACAVTLDARGGFTESKSICRRCFPAASVCPRKVSVWLSLGVFQERHQGTHSPNVKSPRFGGVKTVGLEVTFQRTSALGRPPPA